MMWNQYSHYHWHYPMYRNWNNSSWNNNNNNWNNNGWNNNNWNNDNWNNNWDNNWNNNVWDNNWNPNNNSNDYGPNPYVVDIEQVTKENNNFRTALWTGEYLQLTLMSIGVGEDIGLEIHPDHDQFIRVEEGQGLVQMGDSQDNLDFEQMAYEDYAIFVPAGKWHNFTNTGNVPIKLYSIYAPPEHPFGTVHETKEIAMAAEEQYHS